MRYPSLNEILFAIRQVQWRRVVSFVLAMLLFTTSAPFPAFSVESEQGSAAEEGTSNSGELIYDYDTLKIMLDGEETYSLSLYEHEKIEIEAGRLSEDANYQWQVQHPENDDVWVNIYDGTDQAISVTAALVGNVLRADGTAKLRCRAYTEDYAYLTSPMTVRLLTGQAAPEAATFSARSGVMAVAEGEETPEFVTVTIEYVRYDFALDENGNLIKDEDGNFVLDEAGSQAFTPFIATLEYGTSLTYTVTNPTMVGYETYLGDATETNTSVSIDETNITQNIIYTVKYKPAMVDYSVRYYFQNIYDDLYVENTDVKFSGKGYTGSTPPDSVVKKEFDGFTSLYYQPDTIAADGSTVFAVYYERTYYLMEFDCDGGYGTDTVYVRQGTYISVPTPIKSGYVFQGWDLVKTEQEATAENPLPTLSDGQQDTLPETMPPYNSGYKALWTTAETTYTVVYWIDNDDGTKSYIGDRVVASESAQKVSGSDDLGVYTICGEIEHTHDGTCNSCGHVHTAACCIGYQQSGPNVNNDLLAMQNIGAGEPESGYVYTINAANDGNTYYYLYVNGVWYNLGTNDSSYVSGAQLGTGYYDDNGRQFVARKYYANISCDHTHDDSCQIICDLTEHIHSSTCYHNTRYLKYVDADTNVTVKGDGSTLVNVYYQYKTYTLKFYYAKEEDNKFYVAGGSTWAFSGSVNDVAEQLGDLSKDVWGQVEDLPTINSTQYGTGSDEYTVNNVTGKYYYLQFSAKYGADISSIWPVGIFDRVKTNTTFSYGDYAYFSAWNVDANTVYDETYENKTLKGNYQRLDAQMLIDEKYEDRDTIHFLAFWENGAVLSNPWNKPHQWIYNVYIPTLEGAADYEYNGVNYDLYGQYTLYDDNTNEPSKPYCGQTPTALEGYECVAYEVTPGEIYDTTYGLYTYTINFYYSAHKYDLIFYNYNVELSDKGAVDLPFSTPLASYQISKQEMQKKYYPGGLEPGAYEFVGWYTTPECFDGTEAKWDSLTMPNSNLTLYAKWVPVTHQVTFYQLYTDIANQNPLEGPVAVEHGNLLETAYDFIPKREGYQFVGWFYFDENNKKRFAPDSMEITQSIELFAEWHSGIDTQYEVTYVLKEETELSSGETFPAGTVIADPTKGHSTAGQTKTFTAKGSGELYDDFQTNLFPTTSSHSILMDEDSGNNTFQFEYVKDDLVYYQVRYVDYVTKQELAASVIKSTENAIVTEKFLPIPNYIPQSYYIRKALVADGATDGSPESINAENVITFYYTRDTEHGLYSVEYYLQYETLVNTTDPYDPVNFYQYESVVGSADVDTPYTATVCQYDGYTHLPDLDTVITYDPDGKEHTQNGTSGTVTYTGLTIKIYYERNEYPYIIEYREYGAAEDAEPLQTITDENSKAKFDAVISHLAPATLTIDGKDYVYYIENATPEQRTKSMTIRHVEDGEENPNKLVFYYTQRKRQVMYHAVCTVPDIDDFGKVSLNSESVSDPIYLIGSSAMPATGFRFVGWYYDEECVTPVEKWVYDRNQDGIADYLDPEEFLTDSLDDIDHYYALFEPIKSELTIQKTGVGSSEDNFIFHVQGVAGTQTAHVDIYITINGNGSVTIEDIYCGQYVITELTGWSWEYEQTGVSHTDGKITVAENGNNTITFTNTPVAQDWLGSETSRDNVFTEIATNP